jgi:hypothetical protein
MVVVLQHALALGVANRGAELRPGVALVGGDAEQASGLAVVLRHALAVVVAHPEVERALGGARAVPAPHAVLRAVCRGAPVSEAGRVLVNRFTIKKY